MSSLCSGWSFHSIPSSLSCADLCYSFHDNNTSSELARVHKAHSPDWLQRDSFNMLIRHTLPWLQTFTVPAHHCWTTPHTHLTHHTGPSPFALPQPCTSHYAPASLLGNLCLCLVLLSPFRFLKQTPIHPTKPSLGTISHEELPDTLGEISSFSLEEERALTGAPSFSSTLESLSIPSLHTPFIHNSLFFPSCELLEGIGWEWLISALLVPSTAPLSVIVGKA